MRADIRLLLCCCSAFLPRNRNEDEEDYYELLGLSRDATYDEIRRAYKRKSLAVHPDKIAQRGGINTDINNEEFQKLKEAHEVLSDAHKREMYDAVGAEAMHYLIEPTTLDPMSIIENLHHSILVDRCKVFILVLLFYGLIFVQPILLCLMVDGKLGSMASWRLVLIPFWIFSIIQLIVLCYRVVRSHRIKQSKEYKFYKYASLLKSACVILTVIFLCLQFDNIVNWSYLIILSPLFAYEFVQLIEAVVMITMSILDIDKMITLPQLESEVLEDGKVYSDLTPEERDDINKSFIIVHPPPTAEDAHPNFSSEYDVENTPEYISAQRKQIKALNLFFTIVIHSIFLGLLIPKLDKTHDNWNWWLVFMPVWVGVFLLLFDNLSTICSSGTQIVLVGDDIHMEQDVEQQHENEQREENGKPVDSTPPASAFIHARDNDEVEISNTTPINLSNNNTTPEQPNNAKFSTKSTPLQEEEDTFHDAQEEEQQFQFDDYPYVEIDDSNKDSKTEAMATCCPLLFVIIITCLFVGKLQGADYSSFWILFPFLFFGGISLCCCCCLIFCTPDKEAMNSLYETDGHQQDTANNLDPEIKPEAPADLENGSAMEQPSFYEGNEESSIHDLD